MKKLSPSEYAQAIYEALMETSPQDHGLVMDRFVSILKAHGELSQWDEIEKHLHDLEVKSKGMHRAEVTFAKEYQVDKALMDKLNQVAGQKLALRTKTDEDIVGGVVVQIDDKLLDGSVKEHLEQLKENLRD